MKGVLIMDKRSFLIGTTVGLLIASVILEIKKHCWTTKRFEKQYATLMRPDETREGDNIG